MNKNIKVKVIKKGSRPKATGNEGQAERSRREAARTIMMNVSNWVNDVQSRKGIEAKVAFESLFKPIPSPSKS